ncbi:hypothetical protein GCM10027406_13530 [Leifsonia lichenia]
MGIEEWWSDLSGFEQQWLIANNGDAIPDGIVASIVEAGGVVQIVGEADDSEDVPPGSYLSDEDVDWIEEVANAEGDDDVDDEEDDEDADDDDDDDDDGLDVALDEAEGADLGLDDEDLDEEE